MIIRCFLVVLILMSGVKGHCDEPASELPPPVQKVREQIQGKSPEQISQILQNALGNPSRDLGSGRHIPCWDFNNGSLIETKFVFKSGQVVWLIATLNRLHENLLGSYEMSATSNGHWLGDIVLKPDGTYAFTKADVAEEHWFDGQDSNYFLNHPKGTFKIRYPTGFHHDTLLESVTKEKVVAKLSFSSGKSSEDFMITTDPTSRVLSFSDSSQLIFEMAKPWENYYK